MLNNRWRRASVLILSDGAITPWRGMPHGYGGWPGRAVRLGALAGLTLASSALMPVHAATRACEAGLSIAHESSGESVVIERFEARAGCGDAVPNRCRSRARDRAHACMATHWDARESGRRPDACKPPAGIHGYAPSDIAGRIETAACARGWGRNGVERVALTAWTRGNTNCPRDERLTNAYRLSRAVCEAAIPTSGASEPGLSAAVDAQVRRVMREHGVPGMTVAIASAGKMILNKGYGYARLSADPVAMLPRHRSMIGSVSKAVVTGPVALQAMNDAGIAPAAKTLYGDDGVFGNRFREDIATGVGRYWPIAAVAVSADNKLYTWYMNGTYSIGTGEALDHHQGLRPYSLPPGRTHTEILDIAISANNWVHTWFLDGSHSVGRANDLDGRTALSPPKTTKLPDGIGYVDVLGIAIGKSGNQVHAWYTDGTYSVGNTRDFEVHADPRAFTAGASSRYHVRGIGLAPGGRSYTLLSKGGRIKGSVKDLASVAAPGPYSIPAISFESSAGSWYRAMTLQNLLDHEAGLLKNGDSEEAARLFGVPRERLTYERIHRHFLRTRPLQPPGTYRYSNHGFGLWTLLIKRITGLPYRRYALEKYIEPLGLDGVVRPLVSAKDRFDACPHRVTDDAVTVRRHWNSTTGLAAGGWTASAGSLLRIMQHLHDTHGPEQLEDGGWAVRADGKLGHSGKVPRAGTAYVAMFPAPSGQGSQGVHVALAANAGMDSGALRRLSNTIETLVTQRSIDPGFDLFVDDPPRLHYPEFDC